MDVNAVKVCDDLTPCQNTCPIDLNKTFDIERNWNERKTDEEIDHHRMDNENNNKPTSIIDILKLPPERILTCPNTDEVTEEQLEVERKTRDKYLNLWRNKKRYNKKTNTW